MLASARPTSPRATPHHGSSDRPDHIRDLTGDLHRGIPQLHRARRTTTGPELGATLGRWLPISTHLLPPRDLSWACAIPDHPCPQHTRRRSTRRVRSGGSLVATTSQDGGT